jgi:hypothetical protein
MTDYKNFGVTLTKGQAKKIHDALNKDGSVTIRLSKDNLHGNINLPLTQTQINKIKKSKNGVQLKLSKSQIEHMEKTGGFLPLIPLIAAILGGVGGLTGGIASAVSAAKSNNEQKRHNEAIEHQLKSGNGVVSNVVGKIPIIGQFLEPLLQKIGLGNKEINKIIRGSCVCRNGLEIKKVGNGLFLSPQGEGIFLGRER